ncbi:hypothetical protein [Candidatus Oleimmundimicrobium sp.]|uniref:hypothetical protein n=1 Tax=Candidatus Oleimmundimicrobium sp. TaxID=3060597 RepID=UPI002724FE53|nr:hypothetical protein [Candidatus Oleimmundimicrobium sp.]MDO8886830.1 hypothetical protein [Candidatus Oleimmundimicrobium sp.]
MKKIALIAISISVLIVIIDFVTLCNQSLAVAPFWRCAGQFIGLGCLIVFGLCLLYLFISWFINPFRVSKIRSEIETGQRLASVTETIIRRSFGFILLIATIPFLLNIITLPTIIIFLTFAIYCLKSRQYRLGWEIFWVVLALLIYFVPITPIGWGVYANLKVTRLSPLLDLGIYLFGPAPLIFCTLALFLLSSDLTSRFKKISLTAWRNILPIILFLLAAAYFGLSPFISKIVVEPGYGSFNRSGNYGNIEMPPSPELKFDRQQNLWIYNFQMKNNLQDEAEIEKIFGDKSEIPLSIGENIKIEGAVFANGKILIGSGQRTVITILSLKPFGIITFQGKNTSVAYDFWK